MKRSKIQEVVDLWLKRKVFTLNGIKRSLQVTVRDLNLTEEGVEMVGMLKPDGTDVLGMFNADPEVFQCAWCRSFTCWYTPYERRKHG